MSGGLAELLYIHMQPPRGKKRPYIRISKYEITGSKFDGFVHWFV